ncbi:MAG TPA: SRPBCC domain-containing protein [Chitinophagaceae bacterium]
MEPIIIERTFAVPVEKLWNAITDKGEMDQWYFRIDNFRPEPGSRFSFEGGDDKQTFLHLCRVVEVIPQKKLSHTWAYEGQDEETLVSFDLSGEGNNSRLKLTHEGLEKIAKYGPAFAAENFREGWTMIIGTMLKNYLEK